MRYAVIFHADAESVFTLECCRQNNHEITFLILPTSANQDSTMFSDTNSEMLQIAAKCTGIAVKAADSDDALDDILYSAKESIDGLAAGNIQSRLHYLKLSGMCKQHRLIFTPTLWHQDKSLAITGLLNQRYSMIITRTRKMNMDFLGKKIDSENIGAITEETKAGGSLGTLVTAGPIFKQEIKIKNGYATMRDKDTGAYDISEISPIK